MAEVKFSEHWSAQLSVTNMGNNICSSLLRFTFVFKFLLDKFISQSSNLLNTLIAFNLERDNNVYLQHFHQYSPKHEWEILNLKNN